jgi:hypothetical protein
MSRMVTIAGRFVESATGLISTPWAPTIAMTFLLDWVFDVAPTAAAPASGAAGRLAVACAGVNRAASNQTPLVHSVSLLRHTDRSGHGLAAAATLRPGGASAVGYMPVHLPNDPPALQLRQRRRPSKLAISPALDGGAPR